MTIASTVFGAYGRFVAKPAVAAFLTVAILATNVGLILGSQMWNVPLATNIDDLWIDPASQVAQNNKIINEYSPNVTASNNELFTLQNLDGSNMATSTNVDRWANYTQSILDTVVFYNGTAYTILDVCNGANGQVSYIFGCVWDNPLDYFTEGGLFFPQDSVAQWLLDYKLAWPYVNAGAGPLPSAKAFLWAWAMNADLASAGTIAVYQGWFTQRCLISKRFLCGNNTQLLMDVDSLVANSLFPAVGKLQFSWAKAQLVLGNMIQTGIIGASGTCANPLNPLDMQTNTTTSPIFVPAALAQYLGQTGFQNGQTYSLSACATNSTGGTCPSPSVSTCSYAAFQTVGILDFSTSCGGCIMATMWWMGELQYSLLQGPVASQLPTAGIFSGAYPPFQIYNPSNFAGGRAASSALALTAANQVALTAGLCTATDNVPSSNCTYLWTEFIAATNAGLAGNLALAESHSTTRAAVLAALPLQPENELMLYPPYTTRDLINTAWRSVLVSGAITPINSLLNRFASRPSYKGKTDAQIGVILSGFNNDLQTQNLKPAVFGRATPNAHDIRAGQCKCAANWAGTKCEIALDNICDCDTSLKPTCIAGLLNSCESLATCAGYTTVISLVAAGPTLGLDPSLLAPYSNFANEMLASSGFVANQSVAASVFQSHCLKYLPCIDGQPFSNFSSMGPSSYAGIVADGSWNLAALADQSLTATPYISRGTLLLAACVGTTSSNCQAASAGMALGYNLSPADVTLALNCYGPTQSIQACQAIVLNGGAASFTSVQAKCPTTYSKLAALSGGFLTVLGYFHCAAEEQQPNPLGTSARGAVSKSLWGPATTTGGCYLASLTTPPAGYLTQTDCINAGVAFLFQGVGQVVAATQAALAGNPQTVIDNAVTNVLENGFGATAGTLPNYAQSSQQSLTFAHYLGLSPVFVTNITNDVYGGCGNYFACPVLAATIDGLLNSSCNAAQTAFTPVALTKGSCLNLFANLVGSLQNNSVSLGKVARDLAQYKFAGTLEDACSATGSALGGGDCWADTDCNSALGQGTCNMSTANPLTYVHTFATIAFTNDPEGTIYYMRSPYVGYRQRANAPILQRYAAKQNALAGRRRLLTYPGDFGTLGFVNLSIADANTIIQNWRLQAISNVYAFRDANPSVQADVVTADSATDLLNEISEADPRILVLGYGLMLLYAFLSCTNWSTDVPGMLNGSRGLVSQAGIILVALSVASGLGVSHLLHVEWSAAATQIIPFVMLGLGVSDTFVLLRIFPYHRDGLSAADACAKALTIAGPPMLLVSATNAGVFAVGVLTGMPVVVNFALQSVIVVIANYITTNLLFPALLVLDYQRMAAGRMDIVPCVHVGTSARAIVQSETSQYETNLANRFITPCYTRCLTSIPGKVFVIALSMAFLGSAVNGVVNVAQLGLQLADIAPANSDLANALHTRDNDFGFYTVNIDTPEVDWSLRVNQQGLHNIFTAVMNLSYIVPGSGTPWIDVFISWGAPSTPLYNAFASGQLCDSQNARTAGNCGLVQNPPCQAITADDSVVAGNIPFYAQADFYRCLQLWINNDLGYDAVKPGFPLVDQYAPAGSRQLQYSRNDSTGLYLAFTTGTVISQGLAVNQDFVNLIAQVRSVANAESTPPSFPAGEPIDFWDQYATLDAIIRDAVGYSLLICFATIWILLLGLVEGDAGVPKRIFATFWAAALTTGIIALTVFELYGYMAYAGLKISAIPAISIIMSTGVAVEYTAYIAVAFVNGAGTMNERMTHSLMLMLAPVVDGAVTMFLGVVMLAASPFVFIVKYFFYVWLLIIFFGMFNGIAFLPVLFSLVGPPAVMSVEGKKASNQVANFDKM